MSASAPTPASASTATARNNDPAHVMDFAGLDLGHARASKRVVPLVDFEVNVFGLDEIYGSTRPIVPLIFAHGWANKAKDLEPLASGILGEMNRYETESGEKRARDIIIVTFDQRNHGTRRRVRGQPSLESDPLRLVNMGVAIAGGKQDHELVMNFLPGYLFPNNERQVTEWMAAGISMGGHITWELLASDPRVQVGVPIITSPLHVVASMTDIWAHRKPNPVAAAWPPTADKYFKPPTSLEGYLGKKILTLHGDLDNVLPQDIGQKHFEAVQAQEAPGHVEQWTQAGRGHVITPEMTQRTAEWLWRWGISPEAIIRSKL